MPKYKLMAAVDWIAGTETELDVIDCDDEEEAQEEAFRAACERLSAWVEPVEDDDS